MTSVIVVLDSPVERFIDAWCPTVQEGGKARRHRLVGNGHLRSQPPLICAEILASLGGSDGRDKASGFRSDCAREAVTGCLIVARLISTVRTAPS
jgi:hypothetical protein